jgi:omega-6 fatty acid desaturase (delta-12 desaturase)
LNQFPTIIGFRESLTLASNKLWDEAQQRMISFTEFYQMEKKELIPVYVENKD